MLGVRRLEGVFPWENKWETDDCRKSGSRIPLRKENRKMPGLKKREIITPVFHGQVGYYSNAPSLHRPPSV